MRTFAWILVTAFLSCNLALAQGEETPRAGTALPAVAAEAPASSQAPDLSRHPIPWEEVAEGIKAGCGATAIFYIVVLCALMGWGLFAFVLAVSPNLTERVDKAMHASRIKCFVLGAASFAVLGTLLHVSQGKLAILALPVLAVGTAWGLCGVCEDLGRRAWMLSSRDAGRLARVSLGWPILYFLGLIPVVGWVVVAVLSLSGLGAFFIALFSGAAKPTPRTIP